MGIARNRRPPNIMSQKAACFILFFALTCIFYAKALDPYASADYDDRLANAEQNFWLNKIPQMYLWKLRHLNPEQENLISEDVELPPHRKRVENSLDYGDTA